MYIYPPFAWRFRQVGNTLPARRWEGWLVAQNLEVYGAPPLYKDLPFWRYWILLPQYVATMRNGAGALPWARSLFGASIRALPGWLWELYICRSIVSYLPRRSQPNTTTFVPLFFAVLFEPAGVCVDFHHTITIVYIPCLERAAGTRSQLLRAPTPYSIGHQSGIKGLADFNPIELTFSVLKKLGWNAIGLFFARPVEPSVISWSLQYGKFIVTGSHENSFNMQQVVSIYWGRAID
jgi:hypothetical protein